MTSTTPFEGNLAVAAEETVTASQTAVRYYGQIRTGFTSLVSIDFAFFAFYLVFFLLMDDKNWYDWMIFVELLNIFAIILVVVGDTKRVYQSFYYVLATSFICLAVNAIGIGVVRVPDMQQADQNNVRRRHQKEVLLAYQCFFAAFDLVLLIMAMYYRFGSNLSDAVLLAYEKIGYSMEKFLVDAILLNFNEEGRRAIETQILEEKVKNKDKNTREELTQQLKNYTNEQINSLKKIFTNKPEPPVVIPINNYQPPAQQPPPQIIQPVITSQAQVFVPPPNVTQFQRSNNTAQQYNQPKRTALSSNSFLTELDNISGGEVSSEYKSRKTGLVFNNINNNKKD
jgi:hypothetical protein